MFDRTPKFDFCECLKPFLSAILAMVFILIVYITGQPRSRTYPAGYFKKEYSFEERFNPKKD